jgi:hypothetical protein
MVSEGGPPRALSSVIALLRTTKLALQGGPGVEAEAHAQADADRAPRR